MIFVIKKTHGTKSIPPKPTTACWSCDWLAPFIMVFFGPAQATKIHCSKNCMLGVMLKPKPMNKKINQNIKNTNKPQFRPFQTWHARTKMLIVSSWWYMACWSVVSGGSGGIILVFPKIGTTGCYFKLGCFGGKPLSWNCNAGPTMLLSLQLPWAALSTESFNPYSKHSSICLVQVILFWTASADWLPPCCDFCGVNNQDSQHAEANGMQQ